MNIRDITLLTVSFNNNVLTGMMIKSFLKQSKGIPGDVIIVDNGNITPVDDMAKRIFHVIDNFNHILLEDEHQSSRNHCAAIDYALKTQIHTKWCLLVDNDILFKPSLCDFINTFDDTVYDACGEIGYDKSPPDRLFPYFCLINVGKFNRENISYFDPERTIKYGLPGYTDKSFNVCDTGYSFYEDIKNTWNINSIQLKTVCKHLKGGMLKNKNIYDWLHKHKKLFN